MARHVQFDVHFEQATLIVMPVRLFDYHPTTSDAIEDLLQVLHPGADVGLERVAVGNLVEVDAGLNGHDQ